MGLSIHLGGSILLYPYIYLGRVLSDRKSSKAKSLLGEVDKKGGKNEYSYQI